MAKNTKLAIMVVNHQADVITALLKNGFIDIFGGTQPDNPEVDVSNQKLAVTLKFGEPAFMVANKGIISANPILAGVSVADVNPVTWARLFRADHLTAVMDVSVGTKDANIILPTTHIVRGITVACSSFLHAVAKSTAGV